MIRSFFNDSIDPYSEFTRLQTDMDTLFDEIFGNWKSPNFTTIQGNYPKINVLEKENCFEIVAATPGLSKDNLNISYKEGLLSIKGESKQDQLDKNEKYLCRELKKSNFFRSFRIEESLINASKITSSYNNGELRVILPKKEEPKKADPIQIKIS